MSTKGNKSQTVRVSAETKRTLEELSRRYDIPMITLIGWAVDGMDVQFIIQKLEELARGAGDGVA